MFSKSLEKIAKNVPVNCLIVVKKIRDTWDLNDNKDDDTGKTFAVIKTIEGLYIGMEVSEHFHLWTAKGDNLKHTALDVLTSDVCAFKPVANPTIYSSSLLAHFLVTVYDKYIAERPSAEDRAKASAKLEADIKALKNKLRAERREQFFNGMRGVVADEARKVLQQISVEQHDEVIATITSIVERVADKIVIDNYKLVDDYYNQAYLQLIQLEESIGEKVLKSADRNVARILQSTQSQMLLMANEVAGISEKADREIKRMENMHALQQIANRESLEDLERKYKKLLREAKKQVKKPSKPASKKPVKKPVKKKAK